MNHVYEIIANISAPTGLDPASSSLADDLRAYVEQSTLRAIPSYNGAHLKLLAKVACLEDSYVTCRGPLYQPKDPRIFEWHDDGFAIEGMLLWSNVPTELRLKETGEVITTRACDVVRVKNLLVEHRAPSPYPEGRWFYRTIWREGYVK